MRYDIKQLLALRPSASSDVPIAHKPDGPATRHDMIVPDPNAVISFRKAPAGSESRSTLKFVQDMNVRVDCIVHVFGLSKEVGWPQLRTFCKLAVGIVPLDLRMMRRRTPCEARLIFRSSEEAREFIDSVPPNAFIRGSKPRFQMEFEVPAAKTGIVGRASTTTIPRTLDIVEVLPSKQPVEPLSSEDSEEEVATAVVHHDDWCFFKDGKLPSENIPVYSAQVETPEKKHKKVQGSKQDAVEGWQVQARQKGKGRKNQPHASVTAICLQPAPVLT